MIRTKEETPQLETINRGLWVSFAFHVLIFSFFTLKSVFFTEAPIDFESAIHVDIVGLPDKVEAGTPPPAKVPEEEPAPTPLATPVEKTPPPKPIPTLPPVVKRDKESVNLEKHKEKAALEKLKAMAALDKIKEDVSSEQKKETSHEKTKSGAKVKGNILSPGSSLSGLSRLQHDNYVADLDAHIKRNWALPEWLAKKDYKAQVRVKLDSRGQIISRQITKSSGNQSYDAEVLSTVDRSVPFPPPPEKFTSIVEVDGILIGFPE